MKNRIVGMKYSLPGMTFHLLEEKYQFLFFTYHFVKMKNRIVSGKDSFLNGIFRILFGAESFLRGIYSLVKMEYPLRKIADKLLVFWEFNGQLCENNFAVNIESQ